MASKLVVVDGNALVHRAWHALPPLQTKSGQLVNAVYGFLLVFFKVLKDLKPTHCVVTFDAKGPTFRHERYAAYKATRVKQPDELYEQIPILKDVLGALRVPVLEAPGYEADDVIGTVAARATEARLPTVIVTGDLDTLQLVNDYVTVCTLRKGLTDTVAYDEAAVRERYGLRPRDLVEYRALRGDPSDNIPGVKGIGEKTAAAVIKRYGTVEQLYRVLEKPAKLPPPLTPRLRELLLAHREDARMSRQLSDIVRDVPVVVSLDDYRRRTPDVARVVPLFQALEFKSLLGKLPRTVPDEPGAPAEPPARSPGQPPVVYRLVDDAPSFRAFLGLLKEQRRFALDTETTGLNPFAADLLGISFSWSPGEAHYVVVDGAPERLDALRPVLADEALKKWGHNVKYDLEVFGRAGVAVAGLEGDTMVAAYLLNPGARAHDLDTLAFTEFGHRMIPITRLIGEKPPQKSMRDVPVADVAEYSGEDADYTWRLQAKFLPELETQGLGRLFRDIEVPLIPVLVAMETAGIKVNPTVLTRTRRAAVERISVLERRIHRLARTEFNVASPQQLKAVLFDRLKLPPEGIGKTKTGLSTAAAELEKLRGEHPIIPLILEHRELAKLISTYLDALPELMDPATHRIHTSFNQTVTATGRLSSSAPNLQNIPVRTDLGRRIRRAFVAEPGGVLLSADYSQFELRIVASLANDRAMIDIFRRGEDIHRATAATIHGIPESKVTDRIRFTAKEVNFGIMYGMGPWGLAARTGLSREEARAFIERYFTAFSGVKQYLEETVAVARQRGYVETLFGRRRYLPELKSGVAQVRSAAERMAVNMPIQGSQADFIKLAMVRIHNRLPAISAETKMVLQVHDELVFEVPKGDLSAVAAFVREAMAAVVTLKVPVEVHLNAGPSWGAMEALRPRR